MLDSAMLDILSNVEPAGEPEISLGFPLDAGNFSDDDGPTVSPPAPAPPQEAVLAVSTELLQLILRRDLESRIRIRVDRRRLTRATLEAEGVSLFALLSKAYVLTEWIPAPDLFWRAIWELFPEVDHKIKPGDKPHLVKVSFTASASRLAENLLHASPQLRAAVGVAGGDTAATVALDTVDRTGIFARLTTPVRAASLPRRHACDLRHMPAPRLAGAKARKACKEGGCGHAIAPGRTGPGFPLHTDHAFRRGRELRTSDGAAARAGGARWRPRRESGSNGPHSARRRRGWRSRRVLLPVLPVLPLARIFSEASLCSRATPRKWRQGRRTADLSLRRWSAGLKRSRRRCSRWQHSPTEQWLRPAL